MEIRHRIQLPQLLKELGLPSIGVEIGVAEGFSSKDFLENGLEKLYSVDAWRKLDQSGDGGFDQTWHDKNYQDAVNRLAPFKTRSVILRGLSSEMTDKVKDNSIGLLYLDGDHSYQGVMNDLKLWSPKVVSGGIIAGHDYLMKAYGVHSAVHEFAKTEIKLIPEHKSEDAGFYFINV